MTTRQRTKKATKDETGLPVDETGAVDRARLDGPGHRDAGMRRMGQARERGPGPFSFTATLRRGVQYVLSYGDCRVELHRGSPVPVSEDEARHLAAVRDGVTFHDPMRGRVQRMLDKFEVRDPAGELLSGDGFEEQVLGEPQEGDAFAAAQAARDREAAGM